MNYTALHYTLVHFTAPHFTILNYHFPDILTFKGSSPESIYYPAGLKPSNSLLHWDGLNSAAQKIRYISKVQYSTIQHRIIWYSTVQISAVDNSTLQYTTINYYTTLCQSYTAVLVLPSQCSRLRANIFHIGGYFSHAS